MTPKERVRLHRERSAQGVQVVPVPFSISARETLIYHRLLPEGSELSRDQIATALVDFIRKVGMRPL